jgi:hypothetical protein
MNPVAFVRKYAGANRYRAAAAYLAATTVIATLAFCWIRFVWYPDALFERFGGRELFLLIAGVDLVLGPLIVFIIFVPGKKGLVFDLVVVAMIQVCALGYGVWVLFESRPAYVVFVKDRFEIVRANHLPELELRRAKDTPFGSLPLAGPRVVGARMPTDIEEVNRLAFAAASGVDLHFFPRYYVKFDEVRQEVRGYARPIAKLRPLNPEASSEIDAIVADLGKGEAGIAFLPVRAGKVDLTAIVDAGKGDLLRLTALRPWEYK